MICDFYGCDFDCMTQNNCTLIVNKVATLYNINQKVGSN